MYCDGSREFFSGRVNASSALDRLHHMMAGGVAFEDVFQELFVEAFHVANRILSNRNEAEDVAAETMARALDKWRSVGRMAARNGWVVRVSTNLAIDTARRRRFLTDAAAGDAPMHDDAEGRLALYELFRELPRRQRDVLTLRYLADMSEVDIASTLGISTGSVKRHASRALDRLRRHGREEVIQIAC